MQHRLVCIRRETSKPFPHQIVRLSCSAKMWQGTAAEGFGSTSTRFFFFSFFLPTLSLFSCVAPPTFNPFRDVTMDLPHSPRALYGTVREEAPLAPKFEVRGSLNQNVFEGMITLYKLSNESFVSIHGIQGFNESPDFFLEVPLCSHSQFGLLLSTYLTLSPMLSSVPTPQFFFSPPTLSP